MQFRKGCKFWWLLIPALALDRISKHAASALLAPDGVKTAITGIFSWAYTQNQGAAFSILSGRSVFLILLTFGLIAALIAFQLRHPENAPIERIGLWCIIGGGLGNLWDRIVYGYVIDFIRLDFVNFAVFNAADVFVCAGAALVALSALRTEIRRTENG